MIESARQLTLFANCIPVKGQKRGIIVDLQRKTYFFVPLALCELLENRSTLNLSQMQNQFAADELQVIEQYIAFLLENELAFFTDEIESFPALSMEWDSPYKVTNMIMDISVQTVDFYKKIFRELEILGVPSLQIRCFELININKLKRVIDYTKKSRLRYIEIVIPYNLTNTDIDFIKLIEDNRRVQLVVLHSSPSDSVMSILNGKARLVYIQEKIDSESHCGVIAPSHFRANIDFFTEAKHFNSCLNRKLSIDVKGEIKNCPSCSNSYGNIATTSILTAVNDVNFNFLGSIRKDDIKICQDCEFRYICQDCRVYISDPLDLNSKPSKCGYDPYNAHWNDDKLNPQSILFQRLQVIEKV